MIDTIKKDMKHIYTKYWKKIKLILIFLMFLFFDYIVLIPMKIFNISSNDLRGTTIVILSTFKTLMMMIVLFVIYRKDLINDWDKFRANPIDNLDSGIKYWFLGLIGMVASNLIINFIFKTGAPANENTVQSYISYLPWMMLINAGILAPFTEEIVFRKAFKDAIKKKWLFVIMSGVIFGGMHIIGSSTHWYEALYVIPYSFLGISFALAYDETDTIFTPIALHMLHNTVLILSSIVATGMLI